ncbi:MAG: hypothetical protein Q9188_007032 [Gyalolechia gomerana]
MRLPLEIRADASDSENKKQGVPPSIIVGIIIASLLVLTALYLLLITLRGSHSNPKYIPTSFLKKRWQTWRPKTMKYRMFGFDPISPIYNQNGRRGGGNPYYTGTPRTIHNSSLAATDNDQDPSGTTEMSTTDGDGLNRNTSIRSIMTLPPYRPSPLPNERLIAREGERAGVDVVVEFPETAEEEEARREADMEELYQVRVARRQEAEERRERRHARRAAREAGDWARVEQLRLQAMVASNARRADIMGSPGSSSISLPRDGSAAMLAEHHSRASSRERRVSSVSYADLGLARHDGSRIRADSVESDHRPLLDSAASMGGSRHEALFQVRSRPGQHYRNASTGSVLTMDSDGPAVDTPQTSNRDGSDPPVLTPSVTQGSSGSERSGSHPRDDPPRYEDEEAPPYTSPVRNSAPQLPEVRAVPAIEVEVATPMSSVPVTPTDRHDRGR